MWGPEKKTMLDVGSFLERDRQGLDQIYMSIYRFVQSMRSCTTASHWDEWVGRHLIQQGSLLFLPLNYTHYV